MKNVEHGMKHYDELKVVGPYVLIEKIMSKPESNSFLLGDFDPNMIL